MDYLPTYNLEAERYVLGCVLMDETIFDDLKLVTEHFTDTRNAVIWKAMQSIKRDGKQIDMVSVIMRLGKDVQDIGADYLADLTSYIPSTMDWKSYQDAIIECWKSRKAQMIANELMRTINEYDDSSPISKAITELSKLDESTYEEESSLSDTLDEMLDEMMADNGELTGIDTGYADLNKMLGGLQDADLIIVGARPSVGKTAFALNLGDKAVSQNVVTSIFSLEMSKKLLLKRMISARGFIDANKMRNPNSNFDKEDWDKATKSMTELKKFPLHIYDKPGVTMAEIRAKVRALKKKFPDKKHLCIIDYLQLIQGGNGQNRVAVLGDISRALKLMAREFNMPVIALSQLSRSVDSRQDKHPMLSDLRESGNIEQDADVIAFLYRDDYYNPESEKKNIIEIDIAKQRNGETGRVDLAYLKKYNKFVNLEKNL